MRVPGQKFFVPANRLIASMTRAYKKHPLPLAGGGLGRG
jgi:hypothetical protein